MPPHLPTAPSAQGPSLILIGGGGHALVVAEAAILAGLAIAGFLDDSPRPALAADPFRAPRLGGLGRLDLLQGHLWILSLGDLAARAALLPQLTHCPGAASVIHPSAHISPSASIGRAVYIGPHAVIHTRASIADHAVINSGAIIEHDCRIGRNAHVAPGAVLGGSVTVGEDTLVGLGSRVLPNLAIGRACTIGAGAVVTSPVEDNATVVGIPAVPSKSALR